VSFDDSLETDLSQVERVLVLGSDDDDGDESEEANLVSQHAGRNRTSSGMHALKPGGGVKRLFNGLALDVSFLALACLPFDDKETFGAEEKVDSPIL